MRAGRRFTPHSRRNSALAAIGAMTVATLTWVLAVQVAGVALRARMGPEVVTIDAVQACVGALVPTMFGLGAMGVLRSRSRRPRTMWTRLAVTVAILSLGSPLMSATNAAAGAVLVSMHLLVAAVVIPLVRSTATDEPDAPDDAAELAVAS